tara:strand:+ start:383 stop:511 length:129 start_codon:yes stop_codon:yes gene_type:complete
MNYWLNKLFFNEINENKVKKLISLNKLKLKKINKISNYEILK